MSQPDNDNDAPPDKAPSGDVLLAAVQALRMKQWIKNLLVFAALIFAFKFRELDLVVKATIGFLSFCCLSSAGYLFNDARDREADSHHPKKRFRPIAAGRLPVSVAYAEMVLIFLVGIALAAYISTPFLIVALLYFCTTMSYTFFFKHHVILDVMFISGGFLWRAAAGAYAIDVRLSPWLLTCTAFLTLFIGFNKRRSELAVKAQTGNATRKNLMYYTPELLTEFQAITTSGTIISYALYAVLGMREAHPGTGSWMLLTLPHVLYGIFRYIFLVNNLGEGEEPAETLLKDKPLLLTTVTYGMLVVAILMFTRTG
jgi:4-hydroxybenzoate polyprenyltransferase